MTHYISKNPVFYGMVQIICSLVCQKKTVLRHAHKVIVDESTDEQKRLPIGQY